IAHDGHHVGSAGARDVATARPVSAHRVSDRHADPVPVGRTPGPDAAAAVAGHGHPHGPVPAASRHTRRIVTAVLVPAAVATLVAMIILWPGPVHLADHAGA